MSVRNMTSPRQPRGTAVRNAGVTLCRATPLVRSWGRVRAAPDAARRWWCHHHPFSAKRTFTPIDAAIQSNLRETTTRVLTSLTPREERVRRMRSGIGMNTDHTLEEVGQQFSVTRERIRQIEAKALRKLKHPSRSRKLRSFLDN